MNLKIENYYLNKKKYIRKKININKSYNFVLKNDTIELFDPKNNKLVMKAYYDIAGVYNLHNSVWYWAWNINNINRKLAKNSKLVKSFSKKIKKEYTQEFSPKEIEELYFKTSNGNFYTSADKILPLVKLMMYITHGVWFFPICYGKNNTICLAKKYDNTIEKLQYIIIKNIIRIY